MFCKITKEIFNGVEDKLIKIIHKIFSQLNANPSNLDTFSLKYRGKFLKTIKKFF